MKEVIKQLLSYVVIVSALKGLLTNKKYEEYFRFFSSMIMILILLSPLFSILGNKTDWYHKLEANLFHMDVQELEGTLKAADGRLEEMVLKEYRQALEKEVEAAAKGQGVSFHEVSVVLEQGEEGIKIAGISGKTGGLKGKSEKKDTENGEIAAVEAVQIGQQKKRTEEIEDHSKEAEEIKKKLCEKFAVPEENIHIFQ